MSRRQHQPKISGFSLVELSVVLAIVGLLIGGVLAGQSLLKGQRLRAVLTDAKNYATAIQQFKIKYSYLPGDFPTATEVWGRADGGTPLTSNCAAPITTASPDGATTCNGDGNGTINGGDSENFRVWQQLASAQFIAGKYTGVHTPSSVSWDTVPGINAPKGSLDKSGFFIWSWGVQTTDWYYFAGDYNNAMTFGKTTTGSWPDSPALTGEDTFLLDNKIDDGLPASGFLRAMRAGPTDIVAQNCATTNVAATARYVLNATESCAISFLNPFVVGAAK